MEKWKEKNASHFSTTPTTATSHIDYPPRYTNTRLVQNIGQASLSPSVMIGMIEIACEQSARFHEALDPFAPVVFSVSWAGEETSQNWFDTARELTESWHHQ